MKYTETHEWINEKDGVGIVGVTQHAQHELGDIVYVELPEVGKNVKAGEEAAVLESTIAAADVYAPASGKIIEVNKALLETSELVNKSPEEQGWIFKIQITNPKELETLMDSQTYQSKISS